MASGKVLVFLTKSFSDVVFAFVVTTLMNLTPKTQLLLTRNPDEFFSFASLIMHDLPELVLAVWKVWLTAQQNIAIHRNK
jgi:hypothetical protein